MIESSGLSNKEWFDKMVALAEINDLKEGESDYKQDLNELEKDKAIVETERK